MGHGDHWTALLGSIEKLLENTLVTIVVKGKLSPVTDEQKQHQESHPAENTFLGIEYGDAPVGCIAVIAKFPEKNKNALMTVYPFLRDGVPNVMEITDLKTLPQACEATVTGVSRAGGVLSFFEPLYFRNRFILNTGGKYEFSLAAIAYGLEKLIETEITVTQGFFLELERETALKENPDADVGAIESVAIDVSQLRTLIFQDDFPEDAEFQTVVEDVDYFHFDGIEICRMPVGFKLGGDRNFRINLYASEHVLKGYRPQTGDTIHGILWLQGYAVKEVDAESWAALERAISAEERVRKAHESEEYLSDLPLGLQVLGFSLINSGLELSRYNYYGGLSDIPAFHIEHRGDEICVWARSYTENEEPELHFSEEEKQFYADFSGQRGQEGICIVVACKDVGSGYAFTYHGIEELEKITGELILLKYRERENIN
jgi:hypothetical protein